MHTEHLVSMANRIGGFFGSYVDPVEAASEIASHIQKNWDGNQGSGLQPMVLFAIETHRDRLAPTAPML
jgi:hypothetical protein